MQDRSIAIARGRGNERTVAGRRARALAPFGAAREQFTERDVDTAP
jgi:hypothetical protein